MRTSEASSGGCDNWDGEFITSWETEGGVTGISVGPEGNLYVANSGVQQFTHETDLEYLIIPRGVQLG